MKLEMTFRDDEAKRQEELKVEIQKILAAFKQTGELEWAHDAILALCNRAIEAEREEKSRLANGFLIAYDLAAIDAEPLPERLPESVYVDGYMDKVRELREVFQIATAIRRAE